MDKMKFESANLTEKNIEKIAELFPNCITETVDENGKLKKAINFEMLQAMLSEDIAEGDEAYEFTWVGKKAAIAEANKPIRKTLRPCPEESVNWDTTENLYIEGDNLEVLKLLQESYLGKVKMIYIDPPYNTGNDFIYRDKFTRSTGEYEEQLSIFDEDDNRLFKNTDSNGRFHSDWCSMIYSRLLLARNLLSDDGVIFISIDDNEQENIKKICNEILGEENFIGQLVWQSTQKNDPRFIAVNHEYVLCYVKNVIVQNIGGKWRTKHPLVDDMMKEYEKIRSKYSKIEDIQNAWSVIVAKDKYAPLKHYKFVDTRGPYFAADISDPQRNGPKHDFVIHPVTGQVCKPPAGGYSPREAEMRRRLENDEIHFGPTHESVVCSKKYLITAEDRLNSVYYEDGRRATKLLESIIGKGVFEHPKSEILINRLMGFTIKKEDIVLDFFSGSATTAHAVMQLNAEDSGHRKFIMVQIPEICDEKSEAAKAGYKNICEIGKERIRRAGERIKYETSIAAPFEKAEKETGLAVSYFGEEEKKYGKEMADKLDIGFRVFKLDETNMTDVYYGVNEYDQTMLDDLESNIKPDRTALDLLFGCLLDWGLPLSMPYSSEEIEGYTIHTVQSGERPDLIACFDENIPESVIKTLAKRNPLRAVFRDGSFADSPSKINVFEIFKLYAPETRVKVI